MKDRTEFLDMRDALAQARLGTFLVIPLKYGPGGVDEQWLAQTASKQPRRLPTMDLTETVKELLDPHAPAHVGVRWEFSRETLIRTLFDGEADGCCRFYVLENPQAEDKTCMFDFHSAYLYVFHTQMALLCVGIRYTNIDTLLRICNPGFSENSADYRFEDSQGRLHPFRLDRQLAAFCAGAGLEAFFPGSPSLLLDANTFNLAVVPRRFRDLETMRCVTFNLHRVVPLDCDIDDESEDDVRYVYSVRNQMLNSYRWGCCVSSQTLSYVVADEHMDLDGELLTHAEDGLPLLAIALYEKYTCLRFTQLITAKEAKGGKRGRYLRRLKQMMLEFQAYGTVAPANVSRWYNVKLIYQYTVETNGIPDAIGDIQNKLDILVERQREEEDARNNTVAWVLTLFGIVSILEAILSAHQILAAGGLIEAFVAVISSLVMILMILVLLLVERKRK